MAAREIKVCLGNSTKKEVLFESLTDSYPQLPIRLKKGTSRMVIFKPLRNQFQLTAHPKGGIVDGQWINFDAGSECNIVKTASRGHADKKGHEKWDIQIYMGFEADSPQTPVTVTDPEDPEKH